MLDGNGLTDIVELRNVPDTKT